MPVEVRAVVRVFGDVMPGNEFIHKDPYDGGPHLPDLNVLAAAGPLDATR